MSAETALDFAGLLRLLGFTVGEYVSIGHEVVGKSTWHTAVMNPADAPAYVDQLPDAADVFFGVCPTEGPARDGVGRGGERDITRLPALWADLDVKQPNGCASFDVIDKIIGDLTAALDARPSAVVNSGTESTRTGWWPTELVVGGDIGPALALIAALGTSGGQGGRHSTAHRSTPFLTWRG